MAHPHAAQGDEDTKKLEEILNKQVGLKELGQITHLTSSNPLTKHIPSMFHVSSLQKRRKELFHASAASR